MMSILSIAVKQTEPIKLSTVTVENFHCYHDINPHILQFLDHQHMKAVIV